MSPSRRPCRSLPGLIALAAAVLLAGCGGGDPAPEGGPAAAGGGPALEGGPAAAGGGPALEHIHGLGIDPGDGRLLIATHHGLFAARDGETAPRRVGASGQDIMGFAVVGPGHFIGSGHPGPGQDLPPHLGLIESRDGGETWESVSLSGEADFHVLERSGARTYGFDVTQGRLMVSADGGRTWDRRTPPAGVFSLGVDPRDDGRLVASTEQGVFASADAGRSWRPLSRELAGLVAWPEAERLYLVDGSGRLLRSGDAGRTWRPHGSVGAPPVAFAAHRDALYVALGDGSVRRSTDGGRTWAERTAPAS